jgi:hypothetical protein
MKEVTVKSGGPDLQTPPSLSRTRQDGQLRKPSHRSSPKGSVREIVDSGQAFDKIRGIEAAR